MQSIFRLMLLSVIISFIGFITENIWLAFTKGYIDNRNMVLPTLPGYGVFVICFYLLFGFPTETRFTLSENQLFNSVVYFLLAFLTVSIGELLLGIFTEKFVGIIYWDYSWIPFHMTRYTSLPTSLGFACIIYFFMNHCFTPIMNWLSLLPDALLSPIAVILFTITCADNLYCYWIMYRTHDLYCRWRIHLFRKSTNSPVLYQ